MTITDADTYDKDDDGDDNVVVVRPHRLTTYIDAAYCYRPSSVVCLSVTVVILAKTAELTEM